MLQRIVLYLILAVTFSLSGVWSVQAERRVALVIGNSAYTNVSALANPHNDAEAITQSLQRLDFEVIKGIDLTNREFLIKVREFTKAIKGADIALLFYAGHGLQVGGQNFLAPVDANLEEEADLDFETIPLSMILRQMEREQRTNLVFLDACRDNPLARNLAMSMGTRSASVGRGLAMVETGVGTMISYATQPGNVALDGDGINSPFTTALLNHIETPDEDIAVLLRRVRGEVIEKTNGQQVPWGNSSLTGRVILKPGNGPKTSNTVAEENTPQADNTLELSYWDTIKDSDDTRFFKAYLEQFPAGTFANLAKLKIRLIESRKAQFKDETNKKAIAGKAEPAKPNQQNEEIEVAALEQPEGEQTTQIGTEIDFKDDRPLVRSIQSELNRLGCSAGKADGLWGRKTERAVGEYVKHGKVTLASLDPSPELLNRLRSSSARICPLTCRRGYEVKAGRCVKKSSSASLPSRSSNASANTKPKTKRPNAQFYAEGAGYIRKPVGLRKRFQTEHGQLVCVWNDLNSVYKCRWADG